MNGNTNSGLSRQICSGHTPRVTAAVRRTERGELLTEYEVAGRTYRSVDELEAALRGEQI